MIASGIGGLYAVLSVVPGVSFLQSPVLFPVAPLLMTIVAFGKGEVLRPFLCVLSASAMLGGTVYAVAQFLRVEELFSRAGTMRVFLVAMGISWGVFSLVFRRGGRNRKDTGVLDVEVILRQKSVNFCALRDTGNSLRDPISGRRVLVCEITPLLPLLSDAERHCIRTNVNDPAGLVHTLNALGSDIRFCLLPYRAVGITGGLLAAFKPDKVTYNGKEVRKPLIAIAPGRVSDGGAYSALAGAGEE